MNTGWNWGPNWTSELQQWPFKCEVGNRQGGALQLKWPRMQITHVRSNPASVPSQNCAGESGCQGGSCRGAVGGCVGQGRRLRGPIPPQGPQTCHQRACIPNLQAASPLLSCDALVDLLPPLRGSVFLSLKRRKILYLFHRDPVC